MKKPRTAPVLLASLYTLILALSPGLPQAAKAAEPMTVEGTWVVTWEPPMRGPSNLGRRVIISRQGPGEYKVLWPHSGSTRVYFGSPTEIRRVEMLTFELLTKEYSYANIPDAALQGAAAKGGQRTYYYKLSPDLRTLLFSIDQVWLKYDRQSGNLEVEIKPAVTASPVILTRVADTTGAGAAAAPTPKQVDKEADEEQVAQPAPKAKPAPRRRQPAGGSPRPPELPAGGAVSGN